MSDENASYVVSLTLLADVCFRVCMMVKGADSKALIFCNTFKCPLQGNQAEPASSSRDAFGSPADLKTVHSTSPSSEEVSIEDQSDEESASSGDEVDDETAESDLKPYIFSSDGVQDFRKLLLCCTTSNIQACLALQVLGVCL